MSGEFGFNCAEQAGAASFDCLRWRRENNYPATGSHFKTTEEIPPLSPTQATVYFLPAQIMVGLLINVAQANDFIQGSVKSIMPAATPFQIWLLRLSQLACLE